MDSWTNDEKKTLIIFWLSLYSLKRDQWRALLTSLRCNYLTQNVAWPKTIDSRDRQSQSRCRIMSFPHSWTEPRLFPDFPVRSSAENDLVMNPRHRCCVETARSTSTELDCSRISCKESSRNPLGAVWKWRHANLKLFLTPLPLCHTKMPALKNSVTPPPHGCVTSFMDDP